MKALCLKLLKNYKQSEKTYVSLLRSFNREEGHKIAKYIFGMILMPLETNRKKIMQYVEGFQGILEQYEADNIDRRKLIQYSIEGLDEMNRYIAIDNRDPKWLDKDLALVLKRLRTLSFFSRFSLGRQREIMYKMDLKMQQKNTLLFFEPKRVYVIVSGSILMKNHERNIMLPQTAAKFGEGDILNFHQEGSEIFFSVETWFYCQVDTEIAVFDHDYFEDVLWKDLLAQEGKLIEKNVLACANEMFSKLNDLTLTTLVYELCEIKNFVKGDVICLQSKQAPTNYAYRPFYQMQLSKLAQEIKKRKQGGGGVQAGSTANQSVILEDKEKPKNKRSTKELPAPPSPSKPVKKPRRPLMSDFSEAQTPFENSELPSTLASPTKKDSIILPDPLKDTDGEGIYIIEHGKCSLIHPPDQFLAKELRRWDFFGECELLKVIGYTYFGEIIALSDTVRVLYISAANFKKIPVYEQYVMKQYCQSSRQDISMLSYLYSTRYKIDIKEFSSFY